MFLNLLASISIKLYQKNNLIFDNIFQNILRASRSGNSYKSKKKKIIKNESNGMYTYIFLYNNV